MSKGARSRSRGVRSARSNTSGTMSGSNRRRCSAISSSLPGKLFVDEGAHVFISGRRKDALDEAVKLIGRNVTGVQADSADLDDLDRLFETVKQEKGAVDVLWASAGTGEQGRLGEITEEQFDAAFSLNARGMLFTVQKALPLFNDGGSIFMTGSNASLRGYPDWSVYAASKAVLPAYARVWVAGAERQEDPGERADPRPGRHTAYGGSDELGDEGGVRIRDPAARDGPP
jgi:enoyl-[acyl-carrier-protein] reductase (NADH)